MVASVEVVKPRGQYDEVVVHPLVLLSVVDHFRRVEEDDSEDKRVVGVLLGEYRKGRLDVTSSFAVPFEEDENDASIWFLDHSYLEKMSGMFRRINAKEKVVGWYSTGPKIRTNDVDIHELFTDYHPNPAFVIVDVSPDNVGIPTSAYRLENEIRDDGTQKEEKTFVHVPSSIEAFEAEEIGVEHLLRDVKDNTVSTLATQVAEKITSLQGLEKRLVEIKKYMDLVVDGTLPVNHEIMGLLQDSFNLLPNLNLEDYVKAFAVKTNDMMLVVYLSSLIRSVVALHDLINNKRQMKEAEQAADAAAAAKANPKKEKEGPETGKEDDKENAKK
jgi:26S proteasome regulatory subunit N8